ncbi:hypothetical protein, partial [Klebsiella pneumoniae]|uniref:hypothetical protein n=1 Tax=Klebsiella pneumoniae TaxID=573 RepID=UPI003F51B819
MSLRALAVLHPRPAESISARHLLARIAMESGKLDEAEGELKAAISAAMELDLAPLRADLLFTRGMLRR